MADYLSELNKEQRQAAEHIYGPLLIIAGAGTGKTKTMISRAAHMLDSGIAPNHILMLTFTNKAAKEMKERLVKMLGAQGEGVTACTFHSFFALLLRRYGSIMGIDSNFTILSASDEADVIDIVKAQRDAKEYEGSGFPPSAKIVSIISKAVNKNIPISAVLKEDNFGKYQSYVDQVIEIGKSAAQYKAQNNLLNYDDILVYCSKLLGGFPSVARSLAAAYQFIMVDEYQDTNPLQEDILRAMYAYTPNIAVVGDDMQALYTFRGAEPKNIITFPDRYQNTTSVCLTTNYRSNQEILDLANAVVDNTRQGIRKKLVGTHQAGYLPRLVYVDTAQQEADAVLDEIQEKVDNGANYGDIAVLARTARQTAAVELLLNTHRIPYVKYGGQKFFDLAHIKDVLSYLRVLTNPKDEIAWFRILQAHYGIGHKYAQEIAARCRETGREELHNPIHSRRQYYPELELLYNELGSYDGRNLQSTLDGVISFYLDTCARTIDKSRTTAAKKTELREKLRGPIRSDLAELQQLGQSYETIGTFLDDLLLDNTALTQDQNTKGQLVVSTVHSAKGLEFSSVIILDCIDGVFPSTIAEEIGTDDDENELRCFYVAVTRAKDYLTLYAPEITMKYGMAMHGEVAHYIANNLDLVEEVDLGLETPSYGGLGFRDSTFLYQPRKQKNIWA